MESRKRRSIITEPSTPARKAKTNAVVLQWMSSALLNGAARTAMNLGTNALLMGTEWTDWPEWAHANGSMKIVEEILFTITGRTFNGQSHHE